MSEHRTVSAAVSLSETSARGDGALDDVETAEGEGRRCPDTERFPLPSLSETLARGGGALDDVETAEGEGRRCPNTSRFTAGDRVGGAGPRERKENLALEEGKAHLQVLPAEHKDDVQVRGGKSVSNELQVLVPFMTVPALLPATATAVPALERGKETSYCRPP